MFITQQNGKGCSQWDCMEQERASNKQHRFTTLQEGMGLLAWNKNKLIPNNTLKLLSQNIVFNLNNIKEQAYFKQHMFTTLWDGKGWGHWHTVGTRFLQSTQVYDTAG